MKKLSARYYIKILPHGNYYHIENGELIESNYPIEDYDIDTAREIIGSAKLRGIKLSMVLAE